MRIDLAIGRRIETKAGLANGLGNVATTKPLSQTLTVSRRGSGALTVPTWFSDMR